MQDHLTFLIQSLLVKNKINLDYDELDLQIQSHPSYPSLHAVTGVLNHFDVDNVAIRVPVDKETLEQLPSSFIAQIKRNTSNDFALVLKKGSNYKIVISNKEKEIITITTFLEYFTGILIGVEKDEAKITSQSNISKSQKILLAFALVLSSILFFRTNPSFYASIYFILSLVGITISYLIILHDLGLSSKIIDSICAQESKSTNCNAVLNSKGATISKIIKLSDICIIYFASISLSSLLLSITNASLDMLFLISLTAIPIVLYSIYFQIRVAKNWCVLCIGVASVLVLQASIFILSYSQFSILNIESILLVAFLFTLISPIWLFISKQLKQEQAFKKLKISSNKFKRNFHLFNTLLQQSKTIKAALTDCQEIVLGNKKALLRITVITNPFCGHCKNVHNFVESVLKKHHNDINITVRFNINTSNLESDGMLISSRLLELFHTEGELKCLEAMHDIYNNADAKSWLTKWGKCNNANNYKTILEKEYNWCIENNINFTPEILINGKSFPKAYERSDLAFFIEDLHEYFDKKTNLTELQHTL